jgi:hypothetical protein
MDLADWYLLIIVEPECEMYNIIKTPSESFANKVMLQGKTNVPATAMRDIEHVLQGFVGRFVWAYLDNISIYSNTLADHRGHI